jgi:hypothetical protein
VPSRGTRGIIFLLSYHAICEYRFPDEYRCRLPIQETLLIYASMTLLPRTDARIFTTASFAFFIFVVPLSASPESTFLTFYVDFSHRAWWKSQEALDQPASLPD